MSVSTLRLWLEPDQTIPRFRRLCWEFVRVPVKDVLLHGVHPWAGKTGDYYLVIEFLKRFNDEGSLVKTLAPMGYSNAISSANNHYNDKVSRFEAVLESIQKEVYFVDDELPYLDLLELAKERLRARWTNHLARKLAENCHFRFSELRQFLKEKRKDLKLAGAADLDSYDFGKILSLDDFEGRDRLIISEGIPKSNFRPSQSLERFTDKDGQLRFVPEIRDLTVSLLGEPRPKEFNGTRVAFHVKRNGNVLTFRPDVESSSPKRTVAEELALRWRTNEGRFVFTTSMERLTEIVDSDLGTVAFPSLKYGQPLVSPQATVMVTHSKVRSFGIGRFITSKCTGEQLKNVLQEYGVSGTGNKDVMLGKLAKLAAKKYAERVPELDTYFRQNQFIHIAHVPTKVDALPVLEGIGYFRNLILTMYAIRHLRGGAVLEPTHENTTYAAEDLAMALINGNVSFGGAFLAVA